MESPCVSINIGPPINDRVVCELSDSDHSLHPENLEPRAGFTYTGTELVHFRLARKFMIGIYFGCGDGGWKPVMKIDGKKISQQINYIVINKQANSLYSLIADGQYASSLGRNTWKTLIGSQASLQLKCNKEGFNAACGDTTMGKARIGVLGNNENYCYQCDSRIGFGTGGLYDDSNTCGNEALHSPDNENKHIKAMGYILVH
ncbi:hypothetical protein ACROYT_G041312 [Oculina patagonica]